MPASLLTVRPFAVSGLVAQPPPVSGISTVGAFNPSQLTGLVAWFDATQITGVNSGSSMTIWLDSSASASHASSAVTTRWPLYVTGLQNGLPMVRWLTATRLTSGASFVARAPWTVAGVSRQSSAVTTSQLLSNGVYEFVGTGDGGGDGTKSLVGVTGKKNYISQTGYWSTGTTIQHTAIFSSGFTSTVYKNGSLFTTLSGTTDATAAGNGCDVGFGGNGNFFGDIGELLVYSHDLSAVEQAKVESYLTTKWGI